MKKIGTLIVMISVSEIKAKDGISDLNLGKSFHLR
jgi:hypothetical protein